MAMKIRHYLEHGYWVSTAEELRGYVSEPSERTILDWVVRWPEARSYFKEHPDDALLQIDSLMRRLIEELPET
jgi:hypothetical protein